MKEDEIGKVYSDGEVIFREGEEGEKMYVIQDGKVKITKQSPSGDLMIATLGSGDIFGEMALLDRMPRSATAIAFGKARLLGIDKNKLFQSLSRDSTLAFRILESMSQRIRRMDEELAKLKKKKINICIGIDDICEYVLEEAMNFIPSDNGSIMLLDDKGESLLIRAAFGNEWEPKATLNIGEGIAGDVLRTGKAELINDVTMDSRFKSGSAEIRSLLCSPLKWKDTYYGVINMSNNSERLFSIEDLKMLRSLTVYASIAIQNAMSCAELKNATEEVIMHVSMLSKW